MKSQKGMAERANLREALRQDRARLAYWEDMPPLGRRRDVLRVRQPGLARARDHLQHRRLPRERRPVPGLAAVGERVSAVRQALLQAVQGPPEPPPPPPRPIAVLAPGMLIEDVIAQLTTIQDSYPGAQVRKGRGHHWEIWPAPVEPQPPGQ